MEDKTAAGRQGVATNALVFFARCAGPRSTIRKIGHVAPTIRRLRTCSHQATLTNRGKRRRKRANAWARICRGPASGACGRWPRRWGVSHTSVQRIWAEHGLKPHQVKSFKVSNDPDFAKKVEDIVGLYLPPEKALVLSVDRKARGASRRMCRSPWASRPRGRVCSFALVANAGGVHPIWTIPGDSSGQFLPDYGIHNPSWHELLKSLEAR